VAYLLTVETLWLKRRRLDFSQNSSRIQTVATNRWDRLGYGTDGRAPRIGPTTPAARHPWRIRARRPVTIRRNIYPTSRRLLNKKVCYTRNCVIISSSTRVWTAGRWIRAHTPSSHDSAVRTVHLLKHILIFLKKGNRFCSFGAEQ